MKRVLLFLSLICIYQASCYAVEEIKPDSFKVSNEVQDKDTIITKHLETLLVHGLKKYSNDNLVNYRTIDPDFINYEIKEYISKYALNIINDILEGYGKERCKEMATIFANETNKINFFICIRINLEGYITCIEFMHVPSLNQFMTYEDIKRNSEIVVNRAPVPFLKEYGIELSPWIHLLVLEKHIQEYYKE